VAGLLTVALVLGGCHMSMMPTPVVFWDGRIDPLDKLPEARRTNEVKIFYATDRPASGPEADRRYRNGRGPALRLGEATVQLGGDSLSWEELHAASKAPKRTRSVPLILKNATELGALTATVTDKGLSRDPGLGDAGGESAFAEAINRRLEAVTHKEIVIYVHGAKVNFYNACAVTAQLYHFLGRNSVIVAYSWPTRQQVVWYGADVGQAGRSAPNLVELLEFLAANTDAENINILGYSVGGRLLSRALVALRERYPDKDAAQLGRDQRIGDVIFAASDVDLRTFVVDELRQFYDLPRSIVVTISDRDPVLGLAKVVHGASRLGAPDLDELTEQELIDLIELDAQQKIHAIDVTYGERPREYGPSTGHGYWYKSTWVSTDVLASLRFDLRPDQRGLVLKDEKEQWYFPEDYPNRIVEAVEMNRGEAP
jgi:esterase/lipase superfamily enzyme